MLRLTHVLRVATLLSTFSLAAWASVAFGACAVTTVSVAFGQYDVFATMETESTGGISIDCDTNTPYDISLSAGSGSLAARQMTSGIHTLDYNLFVDASRTTVWGDGNSGTATVSGAAFGTVLHTVYGRVPARQNVHAGSYTDVVIVTVTY